MILFHLHNFLTLLSKKKPLKQSSKPEFQKSNPIKISKEFKNLGTYFGSIIGKFLLLSSALTLTSVCGNNFFLPHFSYRNSKK